MTGCLHSSFDFQDDATDDLNAEKERLELEEVRAVEALWAKFAETEKYKFKDDKPILEAIEAVLKACKSYQSVLEVALPKAIADARRGLKLPKNNRKMMLRLLFCVSCIDEEGIYGTTADQSHIHETVALLQALIIQKHEAKTGCRVDLTPFETPEIRIYRAKLESSETGYKEILTSLTKDVSDLNAKKPLQNDIKKENNILSSKKDQKHEDEKKEINRKKKNELGKKLKNSRFKSGIEMLATNRPKRHIKMPSRFLFDDEEKEGERMRKRPRMSKRSTKTKSLNIVNGTHGVAEHNIKCEKKSEEATDLIAPSVDSSSMETIVLIPEEESSSENNDNIGFTDNENEMILKSDIADVIAVHETKCDFGGMVHDVFQYFAISDNGAKKEVSKRAYELWIENRISKEKVTGSMEEQEANSGHTPDKGIKNNSMEREQSESLVFKQQTPVSDLVLSSDKMDSSNEYETKRENELDFTSARASTSNCETHTISENASIEYSQNESCGPWRQIAFRKEASLKEPVKMDKLKTQYDHLLMISEKKYLEKLRSEWMYVPEGGSFDEKVKHIRQMLQEMEDVLSQPASTWKDYFNIKRGLQTLIDNVIVDFSVLSGQDGSDEASRENKSELFSEKSTTSGSKQDDVDVTRSNPS